MSVAVQQRNILKPRLNWLLVFVPISLYAELIAHNELLAFFTAAAAILPLAGLIGHATDELAIHVGPRLGGILNATFGNVTELIIAVFLVLRGEFETVKASLTGSILGNLLLVLGLSLLLGGLRHSEQKFNAKAASVHSASLVLAVIGLLMPALFLLTAGRTNFVQREVLSGVVAAVLMVLYVGALIFTLVTHQHLFRTPHEHEEPKWSKAKALTLLVVAAGLVALEAEVLVGAMEPTVERLGLSRMFVGLIVVPIIGNAAEHSAAILFAMRNKMDIALEIAIGSSTQIALFIAPALVFISLATGHPMDFLFSPFEIAAVGLSTLIVAQIAGDGESNWLEGAQLVGAYVIIAMSFFFLQG
ncbi:MAG TPA: calcium/proton exchanger [Actinomycetota bacterium]|nr:calcium/proton exchanger [Actinomycetota bacterium]